MFTLNTDTVVSVMCIIEVQLLTWIHEALNNPKDVINLGVNEDVINRHGDVRHASQCVFIDAWQRSFKIFWRVLSAHLPANPKAVSIKHLNTRTIGTLVEFPFTYCERGRSFTEGCWGGDTMYSVHYVVKDYSE